jgi:hypothetical protein
VILDGKKYLGPGTSKEARQIKERVAHTVFVKDVNGYIFQRPSVVFAYPLRQDEHRLEALFVQMTDEVENRSFSSIR